MIATMKKTLLNCIGLLVLGLAANTVGAAEEEHSAAQPTRSGEEIAQACIACHGEKGISQSGMYPHLAGQHADYLMQALHDYQSGRRKNPIMGAMAATLSDADIEAVAHYFAAQEGLITPSAHGEVD